MTADELRAEIVRLGPWHHDVEVAPGVRTGEITRSITYDPAFGEPTIIQPERRIAQLVEEVFPEGLAGRSFLDCACNAGGYLFAAVRNGAGRSFGFDVRDHWIRQARFLAGHLASDAIEFDTRDLAALPELGLERFDVTLFNGIFYHLPDPVGGLRIAADLTNELLIVNTDCKPSKTDTLVLNRESTTEVMSGVHRLAWLPSSERVLQDILQWCGFPHTRLRFLRRATGDRYRMEILAARSADTFAQYDTYRAARSEGPARRWLRRLFG